MPTAANYDDAREVLPKCMQDLTDAGILPQNIFTYHLGYIMSKDRPGAYTAGQADIPPIFRLLSPDEMKQYDAIYFCGGNPAHLLDELIRTGFCDIVKQAVENGLFYIGVSAGSIVAAKNLLSNLGYLNSTLSVHTRTGTAKGVFDNNMVSHIDLTDNSAVLINNGRYEVIE
ncbi:MAG: hypothetical protein FIA99_18070 [Ruminiclostridium sp.]|nr:hypothetical protein [Ruminiclostridium sp.]